MRRILLIDDDCNLRMAICKHLTDAGYTVSIGGNGWEGLSELEKEPADLIILDAVMPAMDGPTFLRILRSDVQRQKLPVILIAAEDPLDVKASIGTDEVVCTLQKGQEGFVAKLTVAVARVLEGKTRQNLP